MSYIYLFNNKNILISHYYCNYLFYNMIISLLFFIFFLVPMTSRTSIAGEVETPGELFESYSRDEMAVIAGYGEEKLSTVLVTGSVHCQACLSQYQTHAWPVSGALVAVKCRLNEKKRRANKWTKGLTDENGGFVIDLPSNLHAIESLERKCCVKVLRLPKNSLCKPASVNKHKGLRLSSAGNGVRIYTSGAVRFHHLAARPAQGCAVKEQQKSPKMLS